MSPKGKENPSTRGGGGEEVHMDLSRVPAHVHSVTFSGLSDRTRDDFLVRVAKDILLRPDGRGVVKSFQQLVTRSHQLKQQLQHGMNGCFRSVLVTIDAAPQSHDDNGYTVHVSVRESNPVTGSVMTTASSSSSVTSPTVETCLRWNNVAGRAETVSLSYAYGSSSSSGTGATTATADSSSSTSSTTATRAGTKGFTLSASKPLIHLLPFPVIGRGGGGGDDDGDDGDGEEGEESTDFAFPRYPLLTVTAFDAESSFPASGFRQRERGLLLDYFSHWSPLLTSRLTLHSDRRDLTTATSLSFDDSPAPADIGGQLPQQIRDLVSGRRFVRTGVKHVLAFDGRSYQSKRGGRRSYFPCGGLLAELTTSVCSGMRTSGGRTILPGNQSFAKQEAHVQANGRIPGTRVLVQACLRAGILLPFLPPDGGRHGEHVGGALSDKFFVGGPLSVRGFSTFGIGPSIQRFALGSDVFWSAGAHVYLPLPFLRKSSPSSSGATTTTTIVGLIDRCVRFHVFANAAAAAAASSCSPGDVTGHGGGGVTATTKTLSDNVTSAIRSVTSNVRSSVGAGLVIAAGPVLRLELNYALPLRWDTGTDSPDPGFQFGFGVHFN